MHNAKLYAYETVHEVTGLSAWLTYMYEENSWQTNTSGERK